MQKIYKRGFTLIELLVVIAIIGILASSCLHHSILPATAATMRRSRQTSPACAHRRSLSMMVYPRTHTRPSAQTQPSLLRSRRQVSREVLPLVSATLHQARGQHQRRFAQAGSGVLTQPAGRELHNSSWRSNGLSVTHTLVFWQNPRRKRGFCLCISPPISPTCTLYLRVCTRKGFYPHRASCRYFYYWYFGLGRARFSQQCP